METTNTKIKEHFNKMIDLNSELQKLDNLFEPEQQYQYVFGIVQSLIMDKELNKLSELLKKKFPEYEHNEWV